MSQMMHTRILLFGDGPTFESRHGRVLREQGYALFPEENAVEGPTFDLALASRLDGEIAERPDLRPCVIIGGDEEEAEEGACLVVEADITTEELAFILGGIRYGSDGARRSPRVWVDDPVNFATLAEIDVPFPVRVAARLGNLSSGGAFVRTLRAPKIGAEVELSIGDPRGARFAVCGVVVWRVVPDEGTGLLQRPEAPGSPLVSHPGFAVAFGELSDEQRAQIERVMSKAADRATSRALGRGSSGGTLEAARADAETEEPPTVVTDADDS